jgi:hypothetical protein
MQEKKKKIKKWKMNSKRRSVSKQVLKGHYEWCKKEGRDISWYEPTTSDEL